MDILEGDVLTVSSIDYRIKAVEEWDAHGFAGPGFALGKTVNASTKRPPSVSGSKRGVAAENLTGLTCTPLDPVIAEVAHAAGLETPHEVRQTFLGDGTDYVRVLIEELKTS